MNTTIKKYHFPVYLLAIAIVNLGFILNIYPQFEEIYRDFGMSLSIFSILFSLSVSIVLIIIALYFLTVKGALEKVNEAYKKWYLGLAIILLPLIISVVVYVLTVAKFASDFSTAVS
jgi:hypothetical protein